MADRDNAQERTEQPTHRRRDHARNEGQIARSPELSAAVTFLAGTAILAVAGGARVSAYAVDVMRASADALSAGPITPGGAIDLVRATTRGLVSALLPFSVGVAGMTVAVGLVQTRGLFAPSLLQPKWNRVDPLAGLRRLWTFDSVITLLKSVLKIAALGLLTYWVIAGSWRELTSLSDTSVSDLALVLRALVVRLAVITGLAFAVIAGADYAYQWHRTEKQLRMTRQEIIEEHRESEGDPRVKARILSLARARARRRMLQAVPTADVVVVNPTRIAVALKYDTGVAPAPMIVAMGQRKLAQRIRDVAREHNVPIIENRPVARALLATAKVGQMIPPALYAAIAEILAFVYRQRGGLPGLDDDALDTARKNA